MSALPCPSNRLHRLPRSSSDTPQTSSSHRAQRRFRNLRCGCRSSQLTANRPLRKTSRTCFEGPFGEVIRATGPMAKVNPIRFSTKYQDDETDLLYYGYRYYNASLGRWLSRDPIEESGGPNVYGFVANQPLNTADRDGRAAAEERGGFNVSINTYHYYSSVIISFISGGHGNCPDCRNIKLAQVYQNIFEDLFLHIVRSEDWQLDASSASDPWYPYQSSQYAAVFMNDAPGIRWFYPYPGFHLYGLTQIFETCAYCADRGRERFIGCVSWGHSVGGLRPSSSWGSGKNITPVPPSDTFLRVFDPGLFERHAD
jgi:RHS repeat-associated protein